MGKPRAVVGQELGAPENYRLIEHDPGAPGPGEVRYAVHAAAVNFVDVLVASGKYQVKPQTPFIPGAECAGIVEGVGAGVIDLRPGDRVLTSGVGNAFCEAAIAPAKNLVVYPESMSSIEAATFKVSYTTAYHALVQRGRLQSGETVLVLGAAGGVGYAAIQIAKALGAHVIASASSAEKRDLARQAGADVAIDTHSSTWRDEVKAANAGKGVDVVIDPVGGNASEPAFRSLAWNGRHLVIGFANGEIPRLPTNLALLKGAGLIGVDIRQFYLHEPTQAAENMRALFALQASYGLRAHVGKILPLAQFAEAMHLAASGRCLGRIVLTMDS